MKDESRPQANGDGSLFSSGDEGAELTENQAESQADELGSSAPWSSSAERNAGSWSYDDPERPRWDFATKLVAAYDYHRADGSYSLTKLKGLRADGEKVFFTARRFQGRMGELQSAKQESPGEFLRQPGLELYMRGAGDEPDLLYRLPELLEQMAARQSDPVFITEGEKDANRLIELGLIATTNPNGALNWRPEFNAHLAGRDVVLCIDNDEKGRKRGSRLQSQLCLVARSVKQLELPGLAENGDVTDWLEAGHSKDDLLAEVAKAGSGAGRGVRLEDFHAFMPSHNYIFAPSGEPWPASSVNARIPPVPLFRADGQPDLDDEGEQRTLAASKWLDKHRPVEQMTWAPGAPQVIHNRLISEGGWITRPECHVFNLYRPPSRQPGDAGQAGLWVDHVRRVYPNDAEHLLDWFAQRVQRPQDKINHAIVMGGAQGIGKDTILEPVKQAVGPWNCQEVSPQHLLGRFNGFVKSTILRVSEARDLGDVDRFAFYDHMKAYTAAPPDVLRVDEKFQREYSVFNVCGVIITSNHKSDGIYLPEDDRRHYVAWSDLTKTDFEPDYWQRLWAWYRAGGLGHVAAFLRERDISRFDPKAPPPKTEAFWDIVASNSAPEAAELSDALEQLRWPEAVTLGAVTEAADASFAEWLRDRRNSRKVPHKMEECGYRAVRNPNAKAGRWKVSGKDVVIYAKRELCPRDAIAAAEKLTREGENAVPF